jgi:4-amino-4-deoxy-L-arabinose transferase-like glycosyltransferase
MNVDSVAYTGMISEKVASQTKTSAWASLTIEHALFGLIVLAAVFLRFFALGNQPLNAVEAANGWPAWLAASGRSAPEPPTPTSPLLFSIQTLVFWLAGGGEIVARAAPALAGVATVVLAWWWRSWLGRNAALIMALLLAVDPWLTQFSRRADGAALSLFFGLWTLTALANLLLLAGNSPNITGWRRGVALSAGLLLVSGPLSWSLIAVIALFLLLYDPKLQMLRARGLGDRESLLWFGGAALLGATTWLAQPEGLGLVSSSLSAWLMQFSSPAAVYPLGWWALRILVDQPLLLIFGLLGLARLWLVEPAAHDFDEDGNRLAGQQREWRSFLTYWMLWAIFLALLPGRNPGVLAVLALPLLFAAAGLLAHLLNSLLERGILREGWLLLALVSVLLTSASFLSATLLAQPQLDFGVARGVLLYLLLAALTVVLYALWSDWAQTRLLMGGYAAILLLLVTLSNNWQLNQEFRLDQPEGFFATESVTDLRRLAADIHLLSAQRTGDATQMPVQVQMAQPATPSAVTRPNPVVGWHLRDMRNLQWVLAPGPSPQAGARSPLVITLGEATDDAALAGYMGSRYRVEAAWLPTQLWPAQPPPAPADGGVLASLDQAWSRWLRDLLRWMVYREVRTPPPTRTVVLWVKNASE